MNKDINKKSEYYWDNKILEWEKSYFDNGLDTEPNFIEKIASKFRGPLIIRKQNLISLISSNIKDLRICEFGCGTGDLSEILIQKGAASYVGIDISQSAVNFANNKFLKNSKISFSKSDVADLNNIPDADLYFGLGFIDYLTLEENIKLFGYLNNKKFIFSFPEKKINIINILQEIYLRIMSCPKFFKFKKKSFDHLNYEFTDINNQVYIKNF